MTDKPTRRKPPGASPYTGPRITCEWPGCNTSLGTPSSFAVHCKTCFGLDAPPLKTGIQCNIKGCYCNGVDFPSIERLARHNKYLRRSAVASTKQVQCLAPICGCACGQWFKRISPHIQAWERNQSALKAEMKEQEAQPRPSKKQNTRSLKKDMMNSEQDDGDDDDEEETVRANPDVRESQGDIDEDVKEPDYHPLLKSTKTKKRQHETTDGNSKMEVPRVKLEAQDQLSFSPAHVEKRKRTTIDLTGDSDDETPTVNVAKKIHTPSSKVAIPVQPLALDRDPETIPKLFEIITSQQAQIKMLMEAVVKHN